MTAAATTQDEDDEASAPAGVQRIDKWLWFARIVKSRTLAAGLVERGKVRVNRNKLEKPSHPVKPGDVITYSGQKTVRVFRILAPGTRRGPAVEAARLYEELTERPAQHISGEGRPQSSANGPRASSAPGTRPRGLGRPTKRDRRKIDRLLGGH